MQESLYIAASGGMIQQRKMEVLANNLANVSTSGFKKDGLVFSELLPPFRPDSNFETSKNTLLEPARNNRTSAYTAVSGFATDFTQGALRYTGNPLDLALEGDGFFAVQTSEGIRYTRKGQFHLDPQNRLVSSSGLPLLSRDNEEILVPPGQGQVTIDPQGTVTVGTASQSVQLGQLKLVQFQDKTRLQKAGGGLFELVRGEEPEGRPANLSVRQGFVESSNVNVVKEMTSMIQGVRTFEALQRLIQSIDDANDLSINGVGRVV